MKRSVRHAGERLRLSVGLGPRKKHLFQETYPLCETFQNQNRADVLRKESEGEVTQGETAVSTVVTESYSGSQQISGQGNLAFLL